jgi:hypothetical protein
MYENLSVLALPRYGIALFVIGWAIAAVAMPLAIRSLTRQTCPA